MLFFLIASSNGVCPSCNNDNNYNKTEGSQQQQQQQRYNMMIHVGRIVLKVSIICSMSHGCLHNELFINIVFFSENSDQNYCIKMEFNVLLLLYSLTYYTT